MQTFDFDFDFVATFGREIPEWAWAKNGTAWKGRVTLAAVEVIAGPVEPGADVMNAVDLAMPTITRVAIRKVRAAEGEIDQPVLIDVADL